MTTQALKQGDHSVLKANQFTITTLNILAVILNLPAVVVFVALVRRWGSLLCGD